MKDMLGGSIEPKLRPLEDRQTKSDGNQPFWICIGLIACLLIVAVAFVLRMPKKRGDIYEKA